MQSDVVKQRRISMRDPQDGTINSPVMTMIFLGWKLLEGRPDFTHLLPGDGDFIVLRGLLHATADHLGGSGLVL
jgi:hypothetical protein